MMLIKSFLIPHPLTFEREELTASNSTQSLNDVIDTQTNVCKVHD